MSDPGHDESPQRRARDQAIAAFVPAGLPLWVACLLDELLPPVPWSVLVAAGLGRPRTGADERPRRACR